MIYTQKDRQIFLDVINSVQKDKCSSAGEIILDVGRYFLDAPYIPSTIENDEREDLVVNLRAFDCVTYLESVLALTMTLIAASSDFDYFASCLRTIRYRHGKIDGYASRLHYFSDWIFDNTEKGVISDITRETGGKPFFKRLAYMTNNWHLYPALLDAGCYRRMRDIEDAISGRLLYYIPQNELPKYEIRLCRGDILAITTDKPGIDVIHTGFVLEKGERRHLLHASEKSGKVVISEEDILTHLAGNQTRSGIMLARLIS